MCMERGLGTLIIKARIIFSQPRTKGKKKQIIGEVLRYTQIQSTTIIVNDPMCIFSLSNCERFVPRFSGHCFMEKMNIKTRY